MNLIEILEKSTTLLSECLKSSGPVMPFELEMKVVEAQNMLIAVLCDLQDARSHVGVEIPSVARGPRR